MRTILIVVFLCALKPATAQNLFRQTVITTGVSQSYLRGVHRIPFREFENKFRFNVGYQANLDWGLLRRVSLGFGFTHQKHYLDITNYTYESNGQTVTENPTQVIEVAGFTIRGLWHYMDVYDYTDEKVDLYFGVALHFVHYRTSNTSNDPDFHSWSDGFPEVPGIVGGVRYYPLPFMGVFLEAAIPGPYTISGGLAFRLGGSDEFLERSWW